MELQILKTKVIEHRTWYLCQGNLLAYLESLKPSFYDFAIQRRIIKNQHLDRLYKTIKSGDPIPMITLTYNNGKLEIIEEGKAEVDMTKVEILDGLQRTFRLWSYKILSDRYNDDADINVFVKKLKDENELFFESGVLSTSLVRSLISTGEIKNIKKSFSEFEIFFIVWSGLNEAEVIDKMLVLNAGQKAVSKTHQFELLFLHYHDSIVKKQSQIKLFREKDKEATNIKRGNRKVGEFMFSSIIVALQSFVEMKPLRISTDDLMGLDTVDESSYNVYKNVFSDIFIKEYLIELYDLDKVVTEKERIPDTNKSSKIRDSGKEWFVKDTTLSGIFAALGAHINLNENWNQDELVQATKKGFEELRKRIKDYGFQLNEFTGEYNVLSSRSVNIGNFIRKVVMDYTLELLIGNNPNWKYIFEKAKDRR